MRRSPRLGRWEVTSTWLNHSPMVSPPLQLQSRVTRREHDRLRSRRCTCHRPGFNRSRTSSRAAPLPDRCHSAGLPASMPDGYRIIAAATRPNRQGLTVQARTTRPRSEMRKWIRPAPRRWLGIPIDRGDMPGSGSDWIWCNHRNLQWPVGTSGRYSTATPTTPGKGAARRCWATSRRCFPTRPKKADPPISSRREDGTPHPPWGARLFAVPAGWLGGGQSRHSVPTLHGWFGTSTGNEGPLLAASPPLASSQ